MGNFAFGLEIGQELGMYVGIPLAVIMIGCIIFLRVWASHLNKKTKSQNDNSNKPKKADVSIKPVPTTPEKSVSTATENLKKNSSITTTTTITTTTPEEEAPKVSG